ncbi:electron transport complex subunit RsxG [Uliginosibacterium gangwonense]|uniref:electron transport complex subunit RsxG n=1 Tax=Uliginosibacterium gangwonense TaxID=392736 RepID=UPI000370E2D8|nr:electron transport complex subunit RsxG [Uliginosibacterium gangwonense]
MSEPVVETPAESSPNPLKLSLSTALIMSIFTLAFTALMAGTYLSTKDTIAKSSEAQKLVLINAVLPPSAYDNQLLKDELVLGPTPELGLDAGGHIWRARKGGQPVALVMEAIAPNGYAGKIWLVISVMADGSVGGVRVTEHHETPGLGDYIDPAKDKNKTNPWINQFTGKSPATLPLERWKVKKDEGDFAYRTGATISARAVTDAVARAVRYATEHRETLYQQGEKP